VAGQFILWKSLSTGGQKCDPHLCSLGEASSHTELGSFLRLPVLSTMPLRDGEENERNFQEGEHNINRVYEKVDSPLKIALYVM
jgi:hypothetical protein